MKKLTLTLLSAATFSFASNATADEYYLPSYVEQGLVSICKSAARDKPMKMSKEIKGLRLQTKTVALKVVCNGKDIIAFAESYGAERTTARLSNSIGNVSVTDLAKLDNQKLDVTFTFDTAN